MIYMISLYEGALKVVTLNRNFIANYIAIKFPYPMGLISTISPALHPRQGNRYCLILRFTLVVDFETDRVFLSGINKLCYGDIEP